MRSVLRGSAAFGAVLALLIGACSCTSGAPENSPNGGLGLQGPSVEQASARLTSAEKENLVRDAQPLDLPGGENAKIVPILQESIRGSKEFPLPDLQAFQRVKFWITCTGNAEFRVEVVDARGDSVGAIWGQCSEAKHSSAGLTPDFSHQDPPVTLRVSGAVDSEADVSLVAVAKI